MIRLAMALLRSLLYVPGNRPDLIAKIERYDADAYILDLEDGVPVAEKEAARRTVEDLAPPLIKAGRTLHVRINPVHSPWHRADLEVMLGCGLSRLHVPKVATPDDLRDVDHRLLELSVRWGMKLTEIEVYPTIETPRAVLDADRLLAASGRVCGALFGADDLCAELGVERTAGGREIEHARNVVVLAANAHGAVPIDATYPFHRDLAGCERDALHARELGFKGKQAIHPAQCAIFNRVFTPAPAEVDRARAVLRAAEEARALGRGTATAAGTQIDAAVERAARRLLDWADGAAGAPVA
jgi:citrate lyase subunit beta/citryl-CoA lyase